MYEKRKRIEQLLALMLDLIVVFVSLFAAYLIRYHLIFGTAANFDQDWVLYVFMSSYLLVGLAHDSYKKMFMRSWFSELRHILFQEAVTAGIIVLFTYMLHQTTDISRLMYGYFFVINTVLVWAARLLFKAYLYNVYKSGRYGNKMLLII